MRVRERFRYTGAEQRWTVPAGITSVHFECWGASGGAASGLHYLGKPNQHVGGYAPSNTMFYNSPAAEGQLGISYSNGAGYASGVLAVTPGDTYVINVGGNGKPGYSAVRLDPNGTDIHWQGKGGEGGWNGGGPGGPGALVYKNLYNNENTNVQYTGPTVPKAAKAGQRWLITGDGPALPAVAVCTATYTNNTGAGNWEIVTTQHNHAIGPSGGGGGGATDIRYGGTSYGYRIMVAGGAGGQGGAPYPTGPSKWAYYDVPTSPKPPFGSDTESTGATGTDNTWATRTTYFSSGWGMGGLGGGGVTPTHVPVLAGGVVANGGTGGDASTRHDSTGTPISRNGSGGTGGTATTGGVHGAGGSATDGGLGYGGTGSTAVGGDDDYCAGGGGGGGGYYGGGGGAQGFHNSTYTTDGGGGGGGSSFVGPNFTQVVLAGAARPPMGADNKGTGATGTGGFCRVSYSKPPSVKWKSIPNSALAGSTVTAEFTYTPAVSGGVGIDHYTVGTATDKNATAPTATQTIMVPKSTTTDFTVNFVVPAAGVAAAYFVSATDTDGDTSPWIKQVITGLATTVTTGPAITAPASGSRFQGSVAMAWTLGTQTPLVAFRTVLQGEDVVSKDTITLRTPWHRGGSRLNLWPDPGHMLSATWLSTNNVRGTSNSTALTPATVSGRNTYILWQPTQNGDAENHSVTFDTLVPDFSYHLHVEVASYTANDPRPLRIEVWDQEGLLEATTVDLSAAAQFGLVPVDLHFTARTQGTYFVVRPSGVGIQGDPLLDIDFEDGTTGGFSTGTNSTDYANSGTQSLKLTANASRDITAALTNGAGSYVVVAQALKPASATGNPTITLATTGGVLSGYGPTEVTANTATFTEIHSPFTWDGNGTVRVNLQSDATTGLYYDDVQVYAADLENPVWGNVDGYLAPRNYLANIYLEMSTDEDSAGYLPYFDGTNLNGNTGTVGWTGATNASPSLLTGTDVTSGTSPVYENKRMYGGSFVGVDTLSAAGILAGFDQAFAHQPVNVNPSGPAAPVVTMNISQKTGLFTFSINANDGSATYKTVSFDIFRATDTTVDQAVRIATGLTPDLLTRQATFTDAPATGVNVIYIVRALDSNGGYTDTTDGTVTTVN